MLRLDGLYKRYGRVVAVDGVSLHIRRGEIFGLLGPNGVGKTTTISMIAGLVEPDEGRVAFADGASPARRDARARLGIAPQSLALYDGLTAVENLSFFGTLYGLDRRALRTRGEELLELVGLAERSRHRVGTFSGGMKRRLNLIVAMLHDPPLLLLDEPTAGVDPHSRHAIFDLVRQLRDDGRTIIFTTHYMEEAQRLCDRVAIMDHGRVLALDAVDRLIAAHGGDSVVTLHRGGNRQAIATADPVAVLTEQLRGGEVTSLTVERPDLETVFLNLTGRTLRD